MLTKAQESKDDWLIVLETNMPPLAYSVGAKYKVGSDIEEKRRRSPQRHDRTLL